MSAILILSLESANDMANWDRGTSELTAGLDSPAIPAGVDGLHPSSFILPSSFSARGFHIGDVFIDFPVVQAALSGYSDWAMRVIARRLGAPYTLCEVLLDQFVIQVSRGRRPNATSARPTRSIRSAPS